MVTMGADIEAFVSDGDSVIGALDVFPHTKEEPYVSDGWTIHADNVCIEVATPVATNRRDWVRNIENVPRMMEHYTGRKPLFIPAYNVPKHVLHDPYYNVFGCNPSYNVFTTNHMGTVEPLDDYRYAGGHIHIGSGRLLKFKHKQLQQFVWNLTIALKKYIDIDNPLEVRRRRVYGDLGEIRLKPYGIEFRSLSPRWVSMPGGPEDIYRKVKEALRNA